jgi:hypothetical protein
MALLVNQLYQDLLRVFKSYPGTARDAADRMAAAYASYASAATAGAGTVVLTGAERLLLTNTLYAAIADPTTGYPQKLAQAWGTGYTAFWMSPPIAVTGGVSGLVTAATGGPLLASTLTALYSNVYNTAEVAAHDTAVALDLATRTVIATITPPIPPVPVTLL